MKSSITFRYFNEADLEAVLPRVREAFSRAGMDFDACMAEGMIGFERATTGFTLQIEDLALKFRTAADDAKLFAGCTLRETAGSAATPTRPGGVNFNPSNAATHESHHHDQLHRVPGTMRQEGFGLRGDDGESAGGRTRLNLRARRDPPQWRHRPHRDVRGTAHCEDHSSKTQDKAKRAMNQIQKWIPASEPPAENLLNVIMRGESGETVTGFYFRSTNTPRAGFYIPINAERGRLCTWVKWWIPEPEMP